MRNSIRIFHIYAVVVKYEFLSQVCLVGEGESQRPSTAVGLEGGEVGSGMEKITFLYRLAPSTCPKSYGFNVAHLAQIPDEVILRSIYTFY